MIATRSAFVFPLMVLPLIVFAQPEPPECSNDLSLNPLPRSDGTYVFNISDNIPINCADGDLCPVSLSNVTWEVEPPNQDNLIITGPQITFTNLTRDNNRTTIRCIFSCPNCSEFRNSTVILIVKDPFASTTTDPESTTGSTDPESTTGSTDPTKPTTDASQVTSLPNIGISLYSSRPVYRPNYEASFFCTDTSFSVVSVHWLINKTLLENLNLPNANARFFTGSGRLDIIHAPLVYNGTTIQCNASFGNSNYILSNVLTLLVEGPLSAVRSLSANAVHGNITLTWTAPFSFDTFLSYCVEVNSTTSLIHMTVCGISTTEYSFPIGRVCSNSANYYTFIVTPVNIAGNGERATTKYTQSVALSAPQVKAIQHLRISGVSEVSIYQISMSSPVCDGELIFTDQDTGNRSSLVGSELMISGDIISLTSEQLRKNRHYNVTVSANNAYGSALSHIMLSTHGIKDITVDDTPQLVMTTEYFKSSTSKGAFLFFSFKNGMSIDFNRSFYLAPDRNASYDYTLPDDLTPGLYRVFAYDIESDGTLNNGVGYPADRNDFSFTGHSQGAGFNTIQQPRDVAHVDTRKSYSKDITDCVVTLTGDVISATCSYSSDSAATGFQMVVQMKNTKADVLLINRTMNHLFKGPVTVLVEDENGTYRVAIFPLLGEKGIVNTTVEYTQELPTSASPMTSTVPAATPAIVAATILLVGIMTIIAIIVIATIVYLRFKRNHRAQISRGTSASDSAFKVNFTPTNEESTSPSHDRKALIVR